AAVARIDEPVVVADAVGERNAVRRVGPGAVDEMRDELLVLGERRRGEGRRTERRRGGNPDKFHGHRPLPGNTGAASPPGHLPVFQDAEGSALDIDIARVLAAPQYGNGHSLSFSFAVAHSRASPLGSTIKKNTIIAPNSMNSMWEIVAVEIGIPSSVGS